MLSQLFLRLSHHFQFLNSQSKGSKITTALSFFPNLGKPSREWLGFRPSIPDSKPVISQSSKGDDIIYAFGHGHIGLTLAPVTAEIVESIITKSKPPLSISEFSVKRF